VQRILAPLVTGLVLLGGWYGAIALFGISPFYLPAPHAVVVAMAEEWETLLNAGLITGGYALIGFLLAIAGGFALALIMGLSRVFRDALYPWVTAFQMVPVIALIPVLVSWFQHGLGSVAAITFLISFFPVVVNTTSGMLSVKQDLLELFTLNGATRWQEALLLRVPHSVPYFLAGVRIAATLAPIGAITGDLFAGSVGEDSGLGYLIQLFQGEGYIDGVFAVVLFSSVLGFAFVAIVLSTSHLLLRRWQSAQRAAP
jgi:NitT/TauT family transport system permease protein